jgi:integrase
LLIFQWFKPFIWALPMCLLKLLLDCHRAKTVPNFSMDLSKKGQRLRGEIGKRYNVPIGKGLYLVYRRGQLRGKWFAKLKRPGIDAYDIAPLGDSDDKAFGFSTKKLSYEAAVEAAIAFAKRKDSERTGEIHAGSYTVADAMRDYIAHCARERKITPDDPRLGRVQATIDAFIIPTLGTVQIDKLTHNRLKAWRDSLADQAPRVRTSKGKQQAFRTLDTSDPDAVRRRQASTNRVLSTLKAALNVAKTEGRKIASDAAWVDVKPFRRVDQPKVRFLTMDEVSAVLAACEPDFKALVTGALLTGCRYGELRAMLVEEFSVKDANVYIPRSKNGESRYVDLNAAGVEFFARLAEGRMPTENMFLKANSVPWQESEQKRYMDAACEAAGVEGCTMHILRHTWASHAVMNGMTIEVVGQQLGHKPGSPITSRHYAHLCPTFKAESVRKNAPSFGFAVSNT